MGNAISFPGLGVYFDYIDPVAFTLFGRNIMWYGIIIAAAFLLAALYVMRRAPAFGLNEDLILDMLIFAIPSAIICARIYYVVFSYERYRDDFISVFRVWEGGIAVYGSIIGGVLAAVIFCKVRKVKIGSMLDVCGIGLILGQGIGRWGNFVNAEAYGIETSLPWAMVISTPFAGALQAGVHPTFLYESLWDLTGFVLLHFLSGKRKFRGQVFIWYITWYGFGRGLIEGLRIDSLYFFGTGLRISQFVGFASFAVGVMLLLYHAMFKYHDPAEVMGLAYEPYEHGAKGGDVPEDMPEDGEEDMPADGAEDTPEDVPEHSQDGGETPADSGEEPKTPEK